MPATQCKHVVESPAPVVVEYLPATQLVHAYKPAFENVPATQVPHVGPVPVFGANLPTGQALHDAEPELEKVPAAQLEQVEDRLAAMAVEYRPAAHCVQEVCPILD